MVLQQAERSGGTGKGRGVEALGEELLRPGAVHAFVCEQEAHRLKWIKNDGVAEGEEGTGTGAPRRGLHRTPENLNVVQRDIWRRGSAARTERTRTDDVGIQTFVDQQRESSAESEVAEW